MSTGLSNSNELKWATSLYESTDLMLATVAGILLEEVLGDLLLLVEIDAVVAVVVLVPMLVLRKVSRRIASRFAKAAVRALRWGLAILAGGLFATGFSLVKSIPIVGIILMALFLGFVASGIRYAKSVEQTVSAKAQKYNP